MPCEILRNTIRSVLIVPDKRYYIEAAVYHLNLGTCCLWLMNKGLKMNICNLRPYVMNKDVERSILAVDWNMRVNYG